jgi:hypothetical protein
MAYALQEGKEVFASRTEVHGGTSARIVLIHGTSVILKVMEDAILTVDKQIRVLHILDEPLVLDLLAAGEITPEIRWRFCQLVVEGSRVNPDLIIVTGSSFSPCVEYAREMVTVPVFKVDEQMTREAVAYADKLAVVATKRTSIGPTTSLLQEQASVLGKTVDLDVIMCEEALELLRQGRADLHDSKVMECLAKHGLEKVDAVVLAQVSLARVHNKVEALTSKRVFSSPSMVSQMVGDFLKTPRSTTR